MKPAPFEYHAPATIAEATTLLTELRADEPKVLAGGQSLVPLLNFRLARPGHLVDINRIPGLDAIEQSGMHLTVGALVRHADIEDSDRVDALMPLLRHVARHIGYRQIRYRGTLCGSLCHADPVAEWPMIVRLLDADLEAFGPGGTRTIRSDQFFEYTFTTNLADNEILTGVRLPTPHSPWGWGFSEFSRKVGDFAIAAAVSIVEVEDGQVRRARIALAGAGPTPIRAHQAESALTGSSLDDEHAIALAANAAAELSEPTSDIHGSEGFRRQLIRVQTSRAIEQAFERVRTSPL